MKRIVICFDGTWNKAESPDRATNAVRLYRSILGEDTNRLTGGSPAQPPSVRTIKWYDPGVGTKWYERVRGGVLGFGLSRNIREGYKILIDRYEAGDEIYLFGFSRGAYTARSLAGLIRKVGLLRREHAPQLDPDKNPAILRGYEIYRERDDTPDTPAAKQFKATYSWQDVGIRFLGVWDTVGAVGLPFGVLQVLSDQYSFHDTRLSGIIENAYHAVAVDEHRKDYEPTLWDSPPKPNQHMEQVWFIGAHADVGGGSRKLEYSDITLRWMQEKTQLGGQGLEIDPTQIPDPGDMYLRTRISDSFVEMLGGMYAPVSRLLGRGRYYRPVMRLQHGNESVHGTVRRKMQRDSRYRPKNPGL